LNWICEANHLNNIWGKETEDEEKPNVGKCGPNDGHPKDLTKNVLNSFFVENTNINSVNSANFI
jgi:hypothetical protein